MTDNEFEITTKRLKKLKRSIESLSTIEQASLFMFIIGHCMKEEGYTVNVANPKPPKHCKIEDKDLILLLDKMSDDLIRKIMYFVKLASSNRG